MAHKISFILKNLIFELQFTDNYNLSKALPHGTKLLFNFLIQKFYDTFLSEDCVIKILPTF